VTPTVEGYYQINLKVTWDLSAAEYSINNQIFINNTAASIAFGGIISANPTTVNTTSIQYLNGSSDIIRFSAYTDSTTGLPLVTGSGTFFSVVLLQGGTDTTPTTGKTFIIDHPTDPIRHLVHACLEGPEVGVYYRGKGTIAPNTTFTAITLPAYVFAFANDFTIQITPLYQPGQVPSLYSASELIGNTFEVHGQPGSFYWHVHGARSELDVEPLKSEVTVRGDGPYKYIV
jgi:hypothetical protein